MRQRLDPKDFCPAAGQGSLGIETRVNDTNTIAALAFLDDQATRFSVTAERAALAALGGGCQVPIGIHCRTITGAECGPAVSCWEIYGVVAHPHTGKTVRGYHRVPQAYADAAALGKEIAAILTDAGAGELLADVVAAPGGAA